MMQCISCGGDLLHHRKYVFRSRAFKALYEKRNVYRCSRCNLSQVDAHCINDTALTRYYANEYRVVGEMGALSEQTKIWYEKRANTLASIVAENTNHDISKAFEVGAGYGYNLVALQKVFPNLKLLTDEVSKSTPLPSEIQRGNLDDGPYDVIVLSHVLEHFTDPKALLNRCSKGLKSGGTVVIEVPHDVDNIERLNIVDEPHISFFEKNTLKSLLLGASGLELVGLWAAGPSYKERSWLKSIKKKVGGTLRSLPVVGSAMRRRSLANTGDLDFSRKNDKGVFLRAVLKRK